MPINHIIILTIRFLILNQNFFFLFAQITNPFFGKLNYNFQFLKLKEVICFHNFNLNYLFQLLFIQVNVFTTYNFQFLSFLCLIIILI